MLYSTATSSITFLSAIDNLGVIMTGVDMEFSFD